MTQAPRPEDQAKPATTPSTTPSPAVGSAKVPPTPPDSKAGGTLYGSPASSPPNDAGREGVPKKSPPEKAKRKRRVLPALLIALAALLALTGAGAAAQLTRDLPEATLTTSIDTTQRIPGETPDLPWPADGTAELMIEGLGRLGGSGEGPAEPIGSVAKVMTAYVILQEHPLSGNQEGPSLTVTAADVADYRSRIATNQSLVPVREGTKLTERDALEALMLPSANNVAHQLAIWDAGSESAFVAKMNAAADELGMSDTEYTDPSGFLPTTISTAADQVILGRAAVKNPVFAEIVELEQATIPVAGQISNYNDLLGEAGVFGIKTGSTDEAGGNLLFASRVKVGSRTLILVGAVFNQPGANTPEQLDNVNRVVRKLLTTVRKVVKEYELLAATPAGELETAWGATATVTPADPLKVIGWPGLEVPIKIKDTGSGDAVTAGEVVGTAEASGVRVQLRADATVAEPSLWWRLTRRI
ncbi:D-alanyl-D-alanine carboxypeptidase family protein [Actinoplanes aureus]|uniref:D-alanyl-D-alanine carboxypeptidase n=1 Tax=Actinoplanes aureus TaxID=2792083 RepID=A0A931CCG5_9ACTN|nr:D-alanyl-D-alanine carboxypeptidase [Actinoplanes aureus]MBG0565442.1 D-alanyl-D-alanine carboxypeptidase [Actinoplanes aureus]